MSAWDVTNVVGRFKEYIWLSDDDFTSPDRDNMISFGFSEAEIDFLKKEYSK